jgi:hypothetical protein
MLHLKHMGLIGRHANFCIIYGEETEVTCTASRCVANAMSLAGVKKHGGFICIKLLWPIQQP